MHRISFILEFEIDDLPTELSQQAHDVEMTSY